MPDRWIDTLLLRLHAIFAGRWEKHIESVPYSALKAEWARALAGLTGEQIAAGLDVCRQSREWPPVPAEFRQDCLGGANAEQRAYAARAQSDRPALPSKTWSERKRVGLEALEQAKAVLGAGSRPVTRTDADIRAGRWTREMERQWRLNLSTLPWLQVPEITDWPEVSA